MMIHTAEIVAAPFDDNPLSSAFVGEVSNGGAQALTVTTSITAVTRGKGGNRRFIKYR